MKDRSSSVILEPGRNVWRIAQADRLAFLIDADAYFRRLAECFEQARRQILIVAWDLHSHVRLRRGREEGGDEPLVPFLERLTREHPSLRVHILLWRFAIIYALERESFPVHQIGHKTGERIRLQLDDAHPFGASHHQKIVVVDDAVAFVGGLDLTQERWDTPEHRAEDPRRRDPGGEAYGPFHDVQVAVTGEAAAALGALARERWRRATGEHIDPLEEPPSIWPSDLEPDLRAVRVGIARTEPKFRDYEAVREIEALHCDAISKARRHVFVENQFLTSRSVAQALASRLGEDDGPEVVAVVPRSSTGWLEKATMDALRKRVVADLRAADRHGRFAVLHPADPPDSEEPIKVHSKVLITDDGFLTLGSANLSNRSMGLDTECNLAMVADERDDVARAIGGLRDRLLAEHLGLSPDQVGGAIEEHGSLLAALDDLEPGEGRGLVPLPAEEAPSLLADDSLIDPDGPIEPFRLAEQALDPQGGKPSGPSILRLILFLAALLGLAVIWRWTPLDRLLDPEVIASHVRPYRDADLAPLVALAAYVVGGVVGFPVTLLILLTAMLFGTLEGLLIALGGSLASAAATYLMGALLGRTTVDRLSGRRLERIRAALDRHGTLAIAVVRNVPVAPYTVVNLVAGASAIHFRRYMVGTLLGMAPGIVAMTAFGDQLARAVRDGSWQALVVAAAVVVALGLFAWLVRRRFGRSRSSEPNRPADAEATHG